MQKPPIIEKLERQLVEILTEDERPDISSAKVADFLGMDIEKYRNMAYGGNIPFVLGERGGKYGNGYCKASKLAFWNWINQEKSNLK